MKEFLKIKTLVILTTATWAFCWDPMNSSEAATANVSVINNAFVPASTSINTGDTVLWTWPSGSNFHNVTSTSTPQAWPASFTLSGPATFQNTFATAGTYPYVCTVHGFTGSIMVNNAVTLTPSVSVTSPTNGTVFATPANVTVNATARETNGTIASVQFRVDSNVLTNETIGPFVAVTNNLAAGHHSLTAIASDAGGAKATNTVTINVIAPSPLMLGTVVRSGTNFHFTFGTDAGLTYVVQRSTNLVSSNWLMLATNTASGSSMNFTDVNTVAGPDFYRVGRMSNP